MTPKLIDSYRDYNIISFTTNFFAVPQILGPRDLSDEKNQQHPWTLTTDTLDNIRALIDRNGNWQDWDPLYSNVSLQELGIPEVIEIEPIHTCNLRCVMCHVSYEKLPKTRINLKFIDNLKGMEGKWVKLGSNYEPVAHPQFADIAIGLTKMGMKIDLISNGTLFTGKLIEQIKHCNFKSVTISFDGTSQDTYERIRRRANYKQALERIKAFKNAIKATNPDCIFQINYTITRTNIDEAALAPDFWEKRGFDHLGFIAMVVRDDAQAVNAERVDNELDRVQGALDIAAKRIIEGNLRISVSSPYYRASKLHSQYPENFINNIGLVSSLRDDVVFPIAAATHFQNGSFPGMSIPCRSPFKLVRISHDGTVQLCNQFPIGNIYDHQLLDLWWGNESETIRSSVKEIQNVCAHCEYFLLCIKSNEIDYDDAENFISENKIRFLGLFGPYTLRKWRGLYYMTPITLRINNLLLLDNSRWNYFGIVASNTRRDVMRKGLEFRALFKAIYVFCTFH